MVWVFISFELKYFSISYLSSKVSYKRFLSSASELNTPAVSHSFFCPEEISIFRCYKSLYEYKHDFPNELQKMFNK